MEREMGEPEAHAINLKEKTHEKNNAYCSAADNCHWHFSKNREKPQRREG
jgi:hypothetical protein